MSGATVAKDWSALTEFRYCNTTMSGGLLASGKEVDAHSIHLISNNHGSNSNSVYVDVASLLNNVIWSFHGFHNISVFATEVQNPAKTYRRVMFLALVAVPLTYLLIMVVSVANNDPKWTDWDDSSVSDIVVSFGGTAMYVLVVLLVAFSVVGLYLTSLITSAFLATGMVVKRFGPAGLGM